VNKLRSAETLPLKQSQVDTVWQMDCQAAQLTFIFPHSPQFDLIDRVAESRQPDWVIQAQPGHVSPQMMKTYSDIRRKALDEAASVLEAPDIDKWQKRDPRTTCDDGADPVTSQVTSQSDNLEAEASEFIKEIGSPHWTISATG
jgi:hypothetical protein